jgi:flagellar motor switch protein FliM
LNVLNQAEFEALVGASRAAGARKVKEKPRSIQPCNFRSAGKMPNENARTLNAIHEAFAKQLESTLDSYLGTRLEVKLQGLDQLPIREHIAGIPPLCYIVPFALSTVPGTVIVECDIDVVFPILELLLGGTGTSPDGARDLSEIEDEIMTGVMSLVARQAEHAWHLPNMSLAAKQRINAALVPQYCPATEKVTVVRFTIEIAGISGSFQLVFPSSFASILMNQIRQDRPPKKGGVRFFPMPSIRERILDCDVMVAAGLPCLKVKVRDLIALQPGCVLKLRAPVRTPGMLTVEGQELFEAVPVRNGSQKAAQLGRRAQRPSWEGE